MSSCKRHPLCSDNAACACLRGGGRKWAIPDLGREVDPRSPLEHIPAWPPTFTPPQVCPRRGLQSGSQLCGLVRAGGCRQQTALGGDAPGLWVRGARLRGWCASRALRLRGRLGSCWGPGGWEPGLPGSSSQRLQPERQAEGPSESSTPVTNKDWARRRGRERRRLRKEAGRDALEGEGGKERPWPSRPSQLPRGSGGLADPEYRRLARWLEGRRPV